MNIWRINLKPSSIPNVNPRQFCLKNGVVGVGWRISEDKINPTFEEYYNIGKEWYGDSNSSWEVAINAISKRMKINDLIWTRDKQNNYYLGRIIGEWEYQCSKENLESDIINVRKCDWVKIGTVDSVPGKLVNSFIPPRTLQRIDDDLVEAYSKLIFNSEKKKEIYIVNEINTDDIFSLLSSDDCEDLIAMFLQIQKNYFLIPSSCKKNMMNYEYELKHKFSGESAVCQVKNGSVDLYMSDYDNLKSEVYLFTTNGNYRGDKKKNIHFIDKSDVLKFIKNNKEILPNKIKFWIDKMKIMSENE